MLQRAVQRRFCKQLEAIADQFPRTLGNSAFRSVYMKLKWKLPAYHRNEEALFSLVAYKVPDRGMPAIIALVREQHLLHDSFADEFHEAFSLPAGDVHSDHRGYILRYFFETISNHLDWEDRVLMPLARAALDDADLRRLAAAIAGNPVVSVPGGP